MFDFNIHSKISSIIKTHGNTCLDITPNSINLKALNLKHDIDSIFRYFKIIDEISSSLVGLFFIDPIFLFTTNTIHLSNFAKFARSRKNSIFVINLNVSHNQLELTHHFFIKNAIFTTKEFDLSQKLVFNTANLPSPQDDNFEAMSKCLTSTQESKSSILINNSDAEKLLYADKILQKSTIFIKVLNQEDDLLLEKSKNNIIKIYNMCDIYDKNTQTTKQKIRQLSI